MERWKKYGILAFICIYGMIIVTALIQSPTVDSYGVPIILGEVLPPNISMAIKFIGLVLGICFVVFLSLAMWYSNILWKIRGRSPYWP